jgi:hypothetical protein
MASAIPIRLTRLRGNDADGAGADLLARGHTRPSGPCPHNAIAVMRVPGEIAHPATCFMYGQAYLAQTSVGQELTDSDLVKIVCARGKKIEDASVNPADGRILPPSEKEPDQHADEVIEMKGRAFTGF